MSELEARLRRLEDIDAIKRLKVRYCAHCDDDYNPDGIAELFTEDAVWNGGQLGYAEGREGIREFFRAAPNLVTFAIHHVINPRISVEGDRATGDWYLFQPCTFRGDRAVWMAARYRDRYLRVNGEWKFERVDIEVAFATPYDEGWAMTSFTAP